jgi:integrase
MRNAFLAGGRKARSSRLRDLDAFFKNKLLSRIDVPMMLRFVEWREAKPEVLEFKAGSLKREIAWRVHEAEASGTVTAAQRNEIVEAATRWIENGTKATTNLRLALLRSMFNYYRKIGGIDHVPHVPMRPTSEIDNVRQGTVSLEDARRLYERLPKELRGIFEFVYATGMRSGAALKLTWDMVDKDCTALTIPAMFMKNREPMTLPLVDEDGKPLYRFVADVKLRKGPLFPITKRELNVTWCTACDALGLGLYEPNRAYRGLRMHDLRRTALGNLRKIGVPETVAMSISGHKTSSVFRRYSIIDPAEKQAALSKVPRLEPQPERPVVSKKKRR